MTRQAHTPTGERPELFDRSRLCLRPLSERQHDLDRAAILDLEQVELRSPEIVTVADRIRRARESGAAVVAMLGAHVLRSGVQRYLLDLMERGELSCVALNGGGLIHDFELSLVGATTESVARYIAEGQFGLWEETGRLNDIVAIAAREGRGLGEAVGTAIESAAHPHSDISLLAAGARLGVPVTVHVGIGYDIVHEHPNCNGAAWGAVSYTDFLRLARIMEDLEGGVVMNFGSAIMAPEVFLKTLAMVRNVAHREGRSVRRFTTLVCDLLALPLDFRQEASRGEPGYYFRPWKTMLVRTVADGGESFYVRGRHAETVPQLWTALRAGSVESAISAGDPTAASPTRPSGKEGHSPNEDMRPIPYVDLARQHRALKPELLRAFERVVDHAQFILGYEVAEFERRFAELCGVRHAIGVASGTDALVLALRALGIGAGDEVLTAPNSFVATAAAIVLAGARPVFVDVAGDYNLDVERLEASLSPRTRAILPVHLTGRPADMDRILAFAARHGLDVVEDCAQAVIAEYRGRRVGSFGRFGCFSLHPLKTLNACGDAGALTTDDDALAERARVLRNIGLRTREDATEWSGNSRLDTLQASLLLVKLAKVHEWTEARRAHARLYQQELADLPTVELPHDREYERAVYHTFVIQTDRRDALKQYLAARGIGTAVHYPIPIHLQTVGEKLGYRRGDFLVAEEQATRILSLPIYPELSEEDVENVSFAIRKFYR